MRTMLTLVLLCSLVQFAIAATIKLPECGTIYECYVPELCADIMKDKVVKIDENREIFEDCPAIIKFHLYRKSWARVSIESLKVGTTSITFKQKDANNILLSQFSCTQNGGKIEGKYKDSMKYRSDEVPAKLKCDFDVRLKKQNDKIFDSNSGDRIQFIVESDNPKLETKDGRQIQMGFTQYCDPSTFNFEQPDNPSRSKVYAKIESKPGEFDCEHPNVFKKEYHKKGADVKIVSKITCENTQFELDGQPIPTTESIDIRCVAEAHFFCQEDVKRKAGDLHPAVVASNWAVPNPVPSELKCPSDKPHLIVNDKLILDANPLIRCLNYGHSKYWTVVESAERVHVLTEKGPEVSCTKTVDCHQMHRIPESAVPKGRLGSSSRLPECFASGVMKVNNEVVTDITCDTSTGNFLVHTGEQIRNVEKETIFDCEYQDNRKEADRIDKENKEAIGQGAAIFAGATGALVIVVIIVACLGLKLSLKKDAEKAQKAAKLDEAFFVKNCMTDKEREAYKLDHNLPPVSSEGEKKKEKETNAPVWNKLMMYIQYTALLTVSKLNGEYVTAFVAYAGKTLRRTPTKDSQKRIGAKKATPALVMGTEEEEKLADLKWDEYCDTLVKIKRKKLKKNPTNAQDAETKKNL